MYLRSRLGFGAKPCVESRAPKDPSSQAEQRIEASANGLPWRLLTEHLLQAVPFQCRSLGIYVSITVGMHQNGSTKSFGHCT